MTGNRKNTFGIVITKANRGVFQRKKGMNVLCQAKNQNSANRRHTWNIWMNKWNICAKETEQNEFLFSPPKKNPIMQSELKNPNNNAK